MDKEEFRTKLEEINNLVEKKDYKGALEIVDSIEWRRVKSIRTLCKVGEIYAANKRYEDSKEILLLAYHKASIGKSILYRLIEVSLRMGDVHEAEEFLDEFKEAAPNDNTRYILEYKISRAKKSPIEEQIKILEEYRDSEFTERWSYELAKLYDQAGEKDKCIEVCNDLILWFSEGKYVMKAMELKMKLGVLTPEEQEKYKKQFMPQLKKPENLEIIKEEPEKSAEKETGEEESEPSSSDSEEDSERKEGEKKEKTVYTEDIVTPILETTEAFQEKIANSIKEIFGTKPVVEAVHQQTVEKEAEEQKTIIKAENSEEQEIEDIPDLEPEYIENTEIEGGQKPQEEIRESETATVQEVEEETEEQPTEILESPEETEEEGGQRQETASKEDSDFNMEELILAATTAQGIEVPMDGETVSEEEEEKELPEEEPETEAEPEEQEQEKEEEAEAIQEEDGTSDREPTINLENIIKKAFSEEEFEEPKEEETQVIKENLEGIGAEEETTAADEKETLEKITETEEEFLKRYFKPEEKEKNLKEIVPREKKLTEEEEKLFTYFVKIPGMKEQIVEALYDVQISAAEKTSKTGNVIVMGNNRSGKTRLIESFVPAVCKELSMEAAKVAYVTAEQINGKDIARIVDKLSGGFLVIEEANKMTPETVEQLNKAMEFRTDGLTVIIEDEKIGMRKLIAKYPKFAEKFSSMINIPVFTNDELVNFAKIYTSENGYAIDQMGMLALYNLIGDNQKEDEPMTVGGVKDLIDAAVEKAESGTRKLKRNIAKKRTDAEGNIILYEKDFN